MQRINFRFNRLYFCKLLFLAPLQYLFINRKISMHISSKIFLATSKLNFKAFNRFSVSHVFAQSQNTNFDTIFLRHAHSEFNNVCQAYRLQHKLQYNWDDLVCHSGFADAVAFNPDYIDTPLTQMGVEQCYLTSQNLDFGSFDVIMVSPHYRALQTCANLLKFANNKNKQIPVIVQPLIGGSLWSSCDVSGPIQKRMKQFSQFNFKKFENISNVWFIQNLRKNQKELFYDEVNKRKLYSFKDKQLLTLQLLRDGKISQNCKDLRNRSWEIKTLMQEMKQKHQKILILSHYYIIQYVNSKQFNEDDHKPVQDIDLKNCFPYYNSLANLINSK